MKFDPATLPTGRRVWLRVGKVIDGDSAHAFVDADVIFDAKAIHFVGHAPGREFLPEGQQTPDAVLPDYTLMPCLVEAHAHMFLEGATVDFASREQFLKNPADALLARAKARWPKIVASGIGAVRDAGDKHGVGLALSEEAKARLQQPTDRPWIDSPGAAIYHRGRYGAFMGEPMEAYAGPAECVAARVAAGADRIKLLVSGIINFKVGAVTTPPQMPVEEVRALVAAAKEHGKPTFAHASGTDGVENSIEGGVDTVEHGFFINEDQLARMRDRAIAWVPTFAPVQLQIDRAKDLGWSDEVVSHLRRIIDGHRAMLRRAHEMGVIIIAGSDAGSCGVPHGVGLLTELEHMQTAGLPTMAVLRSTTGLSAWRLGFPKPVGRIATGCSARMILTRHDPTQSVSNLQKPKSILFDGNVLESGGPTDVEGL